MVLRNYGKVQINDKKTTGSPKKSSRKTKIYYLWLKKNF